MNRLQMQMALDIGGDDWSECGVGHGYIKYRLDHQRQTIAITHDCIIHIAHYRDNIHYHITQNTMKYISNIEQAKHLAKMEEKSMKLKNFA